MIIKIWAFAFIGACLGRPPISQTQGYPWPLPQEFKSSNVSMEVSTNFDFKVNTKSCSILESAIDRYYKLIFGNTKSNVLKFRRYDNEMINSLDVNLQNDCEELPHFEMDESYSLSITQTSASLTAKSVWGILRGLETFSQLIYENEDGKLMINGTTISDFPRFSHRGVLLDTSRHFISKAVLKQNLDAMAYNKFNVFHWHIVDDQSFPYESYTFPDLSRQGAYEPFTHVYTQEDVAEIIEYARIRGIRVIPEFDSPGHSTSWGQGYPDLLTECYNGDQPDGTTGPINPIKNSTYDWLKQFIGELTKVFPDKYLHLGGDEVSFACWKSNPKITAFMQAMGYGTDYSKLEQFYMQKLLDIVGSYNGSYIIWQEVIDNGAKVQPNTVVEVWKGGYKDELARVTNLGYTTMLASCWYLNYISYGEDWDTYYACDPQDFNGTDAQKKLVIGGEMTMWGEYVDATNVISRTWPRGSAVAERLWSSAKMTNDTKAATPRLEEHRCRLLRRGLRVEPVNGPGFCRHEWKGD